MNKDLLAFKQLIEDEDIIYMDELPFDDGDEQSFRMGHDTDADGVELTQDAAVFYESSNHIAGTATTEVERSATAHQSLLDLDWGGEVMDPDVTVVTDRHMAGLVPGETMWTETDGKAVKYDFSFETDEDKQVYMPEIVQVFHRVPFSRPVRTLSDLEDELSGILDADVVF